MHKSSEYRVPCPPKERGIACKDQGKEVTMLKLTAQKKVELFDAMKKLVVEVLVEVLSGVISKLISGGALAPKQAQA